MNIANDNPMLDRGLDYDCELIIWIAPVHKKSLSEFQKSLDFIIEPLKVVSNEFAVGGIYCNISEATEQPPEFSGVPIEKYDFCITVETNDLIIWGLIARQFAIALTIGIRTRFESRYLVTNDDDCFILFSGTNLPQYINANYESWKNGEFNRFKSEDSIAIGV
jgi:hypothetical protein